MNERYIIIGGFLTVFFIIGVLSYGVYQSISSMTSQQAVFVQELEVVKAAVASLGSRIEGVHQVLAQEITTKTSTLHDELSGKFSSVEDVINKTRAESQHTIKKLSSELTKVEQMNNEKISTLEGQLKNLRITNKDFSAVIKDLIQSVVSIRTDKGIGSGVIIDARGYLVTNYHVIADATKGAVMTFDQEAHSAQVVGIHEGYDLAVLKLADDSQYPALDFEERTKLIETGAKVVAIGNPGGLELSVTEGIISNVERTIDGVRYIQHDVPINPGNSGGPLINTQGNVVGINTKKREGFEGVGFAIHAEVAEKIVDEIIMQAEEGGKS